MDEIEQMNLLLDQLREARNESALAREAKRKIVEAAQQTTEYQSADATTNEMDAAITRLETQIKAQALAMHDTGAELPEPVKVKWFTTVAPYDETKAREWCFTNFRPALMLDSKTFEKAVKDGSIPDDLATVSKEARAQIATKL